MYQYVLVCTILPDPVSVQDSRWNLYTNYINIKTQLASEWSTCIQVKTHVKMLCQLQNKMFTFELDSPASWDAALIGSSTPLRLECWRQRLQRSKFWLLKIILKLKLFSLLSSSLSWVQFLKLLTPAYLAKIQKVQKNKKMIQKIPSL